MVADMAIAFIGLLAAMVSFAPLIGLVEPMTVGTGMGSELLVAVYRPCGLRRLGE